MDKQRSVSTKFWNDPYIEDLPPLDKLLFIYFLTNSLTNILGVYEISIKKISYDTGLDHETVLKGLKAFEKDRKIFYRENHVILVNFLKNQKLNPNMKIGVENCFDRLPKSLQDSILRNTSKGFESLSNGLLKYETEIESEIETENTCPESKDSGQTQSPSTEKDPTPISTSSEKEGGDPPKTKKILLKDVKKIPLDKLKSDLDYASNLTLFLLDKLNKKYPDRSSLDKANDDWIKDIDKLIRIDKKSREDVLKVIKYYLVDNNIKVWSDAFKSASFLRKSDGPGEPSYFEQMFDQMKSKKNNIPLVHKVTKYDN